ncbi:GNAT family N-acetyltransferase, partial [Streptomyces sp. NPDC058964]|uniref:GNAT family N-acetyltransferase n=1 Tax=Streptomyces sp. NPDC058964 TaxID=3346681 RepID=UPI0036B3CA80
MANDEIRQAGAADVPAVKAVTDAAYHHYIERIGVVPQPMRADHAANVAAGMVFVTGDPVTGLVVIEAHPDHLFLDSIAVRPHPPRNGGGRPRVDIVDAPPRVHSPPPGKRKTQTLIL